MLRSLNGGFGHTIVSGRVKSNVKVENWLEFSAFRSKQDSVSLTMNKPLLDSPVLKPFVSWRKALSIKDQKVQRFDQWLFLNGSSVLLSEKTGELLTIDLDELAMSESEVEEGLDRLSNQWGFHYRLLMVNNSLLKFIVYRHERLQVVLDHAPYCVMVGKLNYGCPLSADGFIDEVKVRWEEQGSIPHEIGIALGYPLDDVFGYMGLLPLPCKGVCGWRVYGCMKTSQRLSSAFNNARCRALAFLADATIAA